MLDKIRTALHRTPTAAQTYTPEDLRRIGRELQAHADRLKEIQRIPLEDLDRVFREATGQ
jgi:hypothetical protein